MRKDLEPTLSRRVEISWVEVHIAHWLENETPTSIKVCTTTRHVDIPKNGDDSEWNVWIDQRHQAANVRCVAMSGQNTVAGWYPTGDGRNGYWDGSKWTQFAELPKSDGEGGQQAPVGVVGRLVDNAIAFPDDAMWSTVGRPITGLGAGRYWMDDQHLYFERGMLSTNSQQVPLHLVMDVDVKQTMMQKARGVFSVYVHINRTSHVERVLMEDVPDGRAAQRVINEAAQRERIRLQQAQNTMRYQGANPALSSTMAAAPTSPAGDAERDPIEQLKQLGALRDSGIVTEEEFAAKKAEILARM